MNLYVDLVYWLLGPEAFRYYFIAVAACSVEYVYGILLTRAPSAEHRSRGYALMYDAVASVVMGAVFVAAVAALAPLALAGFNIPSPDEASERYTFAVERFEAYLIDLAELEKWLAWTAILAPLVGVITSSSLLARISLQMLLALSLIHI